MKPNSAEDAIPSTSSVMSTQFLPPEPEPTNSFSLVALVGLPIAVVGTAFIIEFVTSVMIIVFSPNGRTGFLGSEMSIIEIPLYGFILAGAYLPLWAVYATCGIISSCIGGLALWTAKRKIKFVLLAPLLLTAVVVGILMFKQNIFYLVKPFGEYGREMSYQNFSFVINAIWALPIASCGWAIYLIRRNS
jgi:hypothetical protein